MHISKIFPWISIEGEKALHINKIHRTFLSHLDGYLVQVEIHIQIHSEIHYNLYLNMMIRELSETEEYFLVNENGILEGMTKNLFKQFHHQVTKE